MKMMLSSIFTFSNIFFTFSSVILIKYFKQFPAVKQGGTSTALRPPHWSSVHSVEQRPAKAAMCQSPSPALRPGLCLTPWGRVIPSGKSRGDPGNPGQTLKYQKWRGTYWFCFRKNVRFFLSLLFCIVLLNCLLSSFEIFLMEQLEWTLILN